MEILISIALLLLFAKILGYLCQKIGLASLVGEIAAGIILGMIGISTGLLKDFLDLGIIFLMFYTGLSVKYDEIKPHIYNGSTIALLGGIFSVLFGFAAGMLFTNDIIASLAIGIIFLTTSDSVVFLLAKSLKRSRNIVITATIADDILGIISLSFLTLLFSPQIAFGGIEKLFLIAIGFYLFLLTTGAKLLNWILGIISKFHDDRVFIAIPVGIFFILSIITDKIGLGIATGAFLAGMALANSKYTEGIIEPRISLIANGFFIPIFFASIGAMMNVAETNIMIVSILLLLVVTGKFIGGFLAGRILGESSDAKLIGFMLIPRGDFNIAVAQIVLGLGIISVGIYSSIIFTIVLTIILTSIIMKFISYRERS